MNLRSREASDLQSDAIDRSAISPYRHYCVTGVVVKPPRFSVGEVVGITPNKTKSQMSSMPNPKRMRPFLVPQRFLSNHSILPNISTIYAEKYTTAHHIHTIANPKMICFAMDFLEEVSSG